MHNIGFMAKSKHPTVRVTEAMAALVNQITDESGESAAQLMARLIPLARLEMELEKVLSAKQEAITERLRKISGQRENKTRGAKQKE